MLVICLNCRRIVGCATEKGKPIDNCYHCHSQECKEQVLVDEALRAEVIIARFKNCLMHDSPHIGFTQNGRTTEQKQKKA